jgi:hypothetical protein
MKVVMAEKTGIQSTPRGKPEGWDQVIRTSHAPGLSQKIFSRPSLRERMGTGVLHFVERVLHGFRKIAGVPGDGRGMTGLVSEQPRDDLGTGIHPKKRTQGAEQVGGPAWVRRLAHAAAF